MSYKKGTNPIFMLQSGNNLEVSIHYSLEPGPAGLFISRGRGRHPDRIMNSHELIFVNKGKLTIYEGSQKFYLGQGDAFLLFAGCRHGGVEPYSADMSFFWVHFNLPHKQLSGLDCLLIPRFVSLRNPQRMTELIRRYLDDQETGELSKRQGSLLISLMLMEMMKPTALSTESRSNKLVEKAKTYIQLHAFENISSSVIATELRCNPDYLGRIFKLATSETITMTIQHERIKKAKSLLLEGYNNIDEIAEVCGFNDAGYFRRIFKKFTNMSPTAYQRLYTRMHINTINR